MKLATIALLACVCAQPLVPQAVMSLNEHGNESLDEILEIEDVSSSGLWDRIKYEMKPVIDTEKLQDLITEEALRQRAETLYEIAQKSTKIFGHPTRLIGSKGHWATIHYIAKELRKLGDYYTVKTQKFKAVYGKLNSFSLLIDGVQPGLVFPLDLTPPTPNLVHANLVLVDDFGCNLEDFPANLTAGKIALIKRGECSFSDKSANAGLSGAVGAIIYDDKPIVATLGSPDPHHVPSVSMPTEDVQKYISKLSKDPTYKFEATLFIDSEINNISTLNVVVETKYGDHDNVVSLGAHSDSVAAGPGINDDGSGTISLLEVAKQLSKFKVKNAVRFAWWAAEEEGLLGSTFYANSLTPAENAKIRVFMDYDMMASPNYEYQIYDANNKDHPNGSGNLKDLYVDWYKSKGLNYTFVPFDGRSDYVGFIDNGIPAGGIATGAEGLKDKKGQAKFGGKVGAQFDQCYHRLCDDLTNPNYNAWLTSTQLIAHSVATYAKSFEGFPERELGSEVNANSIDLFPYRGSNLVF